MSTITAKPATNAALVHSMAADNAKPASEEEHFIAEKNEAAQLVKAGESEDGPGTGSAAKHDVEDVGENPSSKENGSGVNEEEAQHVSGKRTRSGEDDSDGKKKKKKKKSKANESSVVYVSRIPPGMDVGALRARLSRMGSLGRVWLRMEEQAAVAARRQLGGRRSKGFADGWVEFTRRRDAKNAVALLNGCPINAAKRGGRWANDLWNLKLLPRDYTWQHLYEETTGGARERVLRMKAAVAAGRRERVFLEERDALARRIAAKEGAASKAAAEGGDTEGGDIEGTDGAATAVASERRIVRRFRQRRTVPDADYEDDVDERRARDAARRLEEGDDGGAQRKAHVDKELVAMLFGGKKRTTQQELK